MNKAIFNLLVALLLLIFLAGCGGGSSDSATNTSSNTSITPNSDPTAPDSDPITPNSDPTAPDSDPITPNSDPTAPDSDPTNQNLAPVADAGADQTVNVGNLAILDGTGSYDPDENYPLTYEWQIISTPIGSTAISSASDSSESTFSFTVDLPGEYTIQIVVTDSLGTASEPYLVLVSTSNSMPVADAGPDQALANEGITVQLDGSQSFDPDGDPITYAWSITSKPPFSSAALNDPTAVNPTFVADSLGTYVIELIVTDNQGLDSFPDEVMVSSENVKPVADAGVNQLVLVGDSVNLDGSGSYDVNLDPLTYSWNMTSKPKGSLTVLIGAETEYPNFEPDIQGIYTPNLVVNDGFLDSDPSNVNIFAVDAANLDDFIRALMDAVLAINGLDASDFNNESNRNALTTKIIVVLKNYLQDGFDESMLDKLRDDIGGKMDGCALGDPSSPDQNDWIMNCPAQAEVYPHIELAISIFETMS
jgi:hypothetical protein